jgi:hypothetical protein
MLLALQKNNPFFMRTIFFITTTITSIVFCGLLFLQSCGNKGADPSPIDQMKTILTSGSWKLQNVLVDGVDKTSVYTGLTLQFTATNFTTTNGLALWPAAGTWQFADDTGKNVTRGDGLPIIIEEATTSKLVLKLTSSKTTLGSGRINSLPGVHVFTFGK